MAADITGILYGLWYNFRALIAVIPPICEFTAKTRQYDFVFPTRTYDFMAKTREYDFVAEDRCE